MQNHLTHSEQEQCMNVYKSAAEALKSLEILPFLEKRYACKVLRKLAYARRHIFYNGFARGNFKMSDMLHDLVINRKSFTNKTVKMAQTEDGFVIFSDVYDVDWKELNKWENSVKELADLNRPDIMPFHIYPFQKEYPALMDKNEYYKAPDDMKIYCSGYDYFYRGTLIGFKICFDVDGDAFSNRGITKF